jgi:hypothetical protein
MKLTATDDMTCLCEGEPHADTCPLAPEWRRVSDFDLYGPDADRPIPYRLTKKRRDYLADESSQ